MDGSKPNPYQTSRSLPALVGSRSAKAIAAWTAIRGLMLLSSAGILGYTEISARSLLGSIMAVILLVYAVSTVAGAAALWASKRAGAIAVAVSQAMAILYWDAGGTYCDLRGTNLTSIGAEVYDVGWGIVISFFGYAIYHGDLRSSYGIDLLGVAIVWWLIRRIRQREP